MCCQCVVGGDYLFTVVVVVVVGSGGCSLFTLLVVVLLGSGDCCLCTVVVVVAVLSQAFINVCRCVFYIMASINFSLTFSSHDKL